MGAPKGSKATLCVGESVAFGRSEGLGLNLNGTDLPDEVYATNDINELIPQILEAIGEEGVMMSYWEGPRETALYFYGPSASRMHELIRDIVEAHPLARDCRLISIN
jgi:hypothetical protein